MTLSPSVFQRESVTFIFQILYKFLVSRTLTESIVYTCQNNQVCWEGIYFKADKAFEQFMCNEVASRFRDEEGAKDFEAHLRSLVSTGFASESLKEILSAEIQDERDWAIGEAIAEAYLTRRRSITWPWNMERDKRTPFASLPGADLVGFEINGNRIRLALGEVKTSGDMNSPPGVMNGRSGLKHQIDNLANNLGIIFQLLRWLLPRCKRTKFELAFNSAVALFLNSGNKAIALFGILIRDTKPNELDLQARGKALSCSIDDPSTCNLIALYLPCSITELPGWVSGGEL